MQAHRVPVLVVAMEIPQEQARVSSLVRVQPCLLATRQATLRVWVMRWLWVMAQRRVKRQVKRQVKH